MDVKHRPAINKRRRRTEWLDKNVFRGWLTPHPTLNKALCIVCNLPIRYYRTDLIQHSRSISHKKNMSLQTNTHKAETNSVEHSQVAVEQQVYLVENSQANVHEEEEEVTVVECPQSNAHEKTVNLVKHPQSNAHEEEVTLVKRPQLEAHEEEIMLVEHPQSNVYEQEIILIEHLQPSSTHQGNVNMVEQSQSIALTKRAHSVESPQSVPHTAKSNLVEANLQLVVHKEKVNLTEPSQSVTRKEQASLVAYSQSGTYKKKPVISIKKANSQNLPKENVHENKVKQVEIKLSAFSIQHNIPFHALDHLVPIIKDISKDPTVITYVSFERNKCASNSQAVEEDDVDEMIKNLRICKFSILLDESSDNSKKVMCVLVQYVSPQDKKITKQVLKLISIELTDPVDKFFEELKKLFEKKKIPLRNIVAVVSENASIMTGCNYIATHLKLEVPRLITLNCIGHSCTIIVNSAYAYVPQMCESFIQEVVSYISDNMEKSECLSRFKDIFSTETKMMLKSPSTKWLVLHKCIVKITENWDILKTYFVFTAVESKLKFTVAISKMFNNDSTRAYLLFLKYSLNFFNNLNDFYQSRRFLSHTLLENSQRLIREVALNFMAPNALNDIVNINLREQKNILSVNDVYVGPECTTFLSTLHPQRAREIRIQCRDFYATAVFKMMECLPYKGTMFEQLIFLQPKIALHYDGRKKVRDLTSIAIRTGHPDITKLAYEWRILPTIYNDVEKEELAVLEIDEMWKQILKYEDFNGDKMFPNLELLVESILTFPHSNFETRHILSMITNIKHEEDEV